MYLFETPSRHGMISFYSQESKVGTDEIQDENNAAPRDFPHPFVLEPPLTAKPEYLPGDRLSFNLVLIGKGIEYLPYFILAFEELGRRGIGEKRGKFQLLKVEDTLSSSDGEPVYNGTTKLLSQNFRIMTFADVIHEARLLNREKLTLSFITPTRVRKKQFSETDQTSSESPKKRESRLVGTELDFSTFIRSLLRRLCLLAEVHCGEKWSLDFPGLLQKAQGVKTSHRDLSWYDWGRYSRHQKAYLKMGGFVGTITFEGDLQEFLPFIKLGEYLHIGNGTAYGLGKYQIL